MKRPGGPAAPVSLILALVFPAIIAAAVVLAYYGFLYADNLSKSVKALFRDTAREQTETVVSEFETRVDKPALTLFDRIAAERKEPTLAQVCEVDPGQAIQAYAVLGANRQVECQWPNLPTTHRLLNPYFGKLQWNAVKLDSWHHLHDLSEKDRSVLLVYTPRVTADDQRYFIVARLNMDLVGKWLEEALARFRQSVTLRAAVVDEEGRLVSGETPPAPPSEPEEQLLYDEPFGKALFKWRIRVSPQNIDEYQMQAERNRWLVPLLVGLFTTVIAVGLGIVWLVLLTERRASRLKSDFIANVSHELKTPLSLIRMFGEMVATGRHKGEDAAREYGAIITRESERLSHLIDNVLDFARHERGKASYDFSRGDLGEVVERALDVCRHRLDKEKLKLHTAIEPTLPQVRMDENALTLLILNLVDNAIKYGAEGGHVDVALTRTPGGVALGVRDYGPGIEREEHSRIFERFYRARNARDRNVRGSGIGLSLVKYIAEAHGGRVTVESPVTSDTGPGTLFRVFLPAPQPDGAESSALTQAAHAKP